MHIGIDNGLHGGLVAISDVAGVEPIAMLPMPLCRPGGKEQVDIRAIVDWIINEAYAKDDTHIWLEKCPHHSMSKAAMRSMAITYGKLIGLFEARFPHMHLHRVAAGQQLAGWQRIMFGRAFKGHESKALALAKAKEIWPGVEWPANRNGVPNDGILDAAVLAEFGRRQIHGT